LYGSGLRIISNEVELPLWVWLAFVVALLTIGYVLMPPAAVHHAAALWRSG
jgi:hypothetical protein